jgi:hypothetical protein
MPDLKTIESLATGHGLLVAVLLVLLLGSLKVIKLLWDENQLLHKKVQEVLARRGDLVERLMKGSRT